MTLNPTSMASNASKRIHQLSTELANQIAAGEVVERPLSVLKELLENSLDAGSTQIDITIERGGIGLIRVQDNGCGICKEDLELALAQHATSKILSFSDLEGVASFGFRGEALASISGVSRLSLSSYVEGQESAYRIEKAGREGKFVITPASKIPGTTIEVRDLFYNTPARRKFLRSEKTETLYLEELFKKIALSHPKVAFTFRQGDKDPKRLSMCRTKEAETRRVTELCGANFIKTAHYIEAESNGLILRGWLGSPQHLRAQADLQFFYVNNRCVRDKVVNHAVRQAFQFFNSTEGKHPAYILFFELDPEAVDVNVHPTKHEVRFREARTVHAFLSYSIQEALSKGVGVTGVASQTEMDLSLPAPPLLTPPVRTSAPALAPAPSIPHSVSVPIEKSFSSPSTTIKLSDIELSDNPLILLSGEFLVCENSACDAKSAGLIIYNIKKIRQWLLQRQLNEMMKKEGRIASKPLLMPIKVNVDASCQWLQEDHLDEVLHQNNEGWSNLLKQLGFDWTPLGPDSILIRSAPVVVTKVIKDKFEKLINLILAMRQVSFKERSILIMAIVNYIVDVQEISFAEAQTLINHYQNLIEDGIEDGQAQSQSFLKEFSIEKMRVFFEENVGGNP